MARLGSRPLVADGGGGAGGRLRLEEEGCERHARRPALLALARAASRGKKVGYQLRVRRAAWPLGGAGHLLRRPLQATALTR